MKSHPTVDQKLTRSQKICMVTPAPTYSRKGNRVTALRWSRILRQLGHQVTVQQSYQRLKCDLMIALHARRSHESMVRFRQRHANLPLILALTGTDLYGDIHSDESAQLSLDMADMFVLLQPEGVNELPLSMHHKVEVIYQSVTPPPRQFQPKRGIFEI